MRTECPPASSSAARPEPPVVMVSPPAIPRRRPRWRGRASIGGVRRPSSRPWPRQAEPSRRAGRPQQATARVSTTAAAIASTARVAPAPGGGEPHLARATPRALGHGSAASSSSGTRSPGPAERRSSAISSSPSSRGSSRRIAGHVSFMTLAPPARRRRPRRVRKSRLERFTRAGQQRLGGFGARAQPARDLVHRQAVRVLPGQRLRVAGRQLVDGLAHRAATSRRAGARAPGSSASGDQFLCHILGLALEARPLSGREAPLAPVVRADLEATDGAQPGEELCFAAVEVQLLERFADGGLRHLLGELGLAARASTARTDRRRGSRGRRTP